MLLRRLVLLACMFWIESSLALPVDFLACLRMAVIRRRRLLRLMSDNSLSSFSGSEEPLPEDLDVMYDRRWFGLNDDDDLEDDDFDDGFGMRWKELAAYMDERWFGLPSFRTLLQRYRSEESLYCAQVQQLYESIGTRTPAASVSASSSYVSFPRKDSLVETFDHLQKASIRDEEDIPDDILRSFRSI